MNKKSIKEGIEKGCYEITGILETGEVVIALISNFDKKNLMPTLTAEHISKELKLKYTNQYINLKGRSAHELVQIYEQYTCSDEERCIKNGLRLR